MSTLPGIPGLPERVSSGPVARVRNPRLRSPMLLGAAGGALICMLATVLLMPVSVVGDSVSALLMLAGLVGAGVGMLAGATLGLFGLTGPVSVAPAELVAEPEPEPELMPAPKPVPPPRASMARPPEFRAPPPDVWTAMFESCAGSLRRVRHAADAVPASPARDWLLRIMTTMRGELEVARALAETGRRLHAGAEHPARVRLATAVEEFAAAERQLGEIIVRLAGAPELHRVGDELRMLEQQLPLLRQNHHD
ncbi:hypothetical protein [Crossiella cryophila]|uniref:Uncharacterized protein n=1 Tax=Crossiella cryophila TaxID=43355 RepID=A0A7W7C4K0_9PSEU|nr:hypothetical protein [Crossiella cryophila]MBB4674440.1 hypothetical protein [Crossiella cryophila]